MQPICLRSEPSRSAFADESSAVIKQERPAQRPTSALAAACHPVLAWNLGDGTRARAPALAASRPIPLRAVAWQLLQRCRRTQPTTNVPQDSQGLMPLVGSVAHLEMILFRAALRSGAASRGARRPLSTGPSAAPAPGAGARRPINQLLSLEDLVAS